METVKENLVGRMKQIDFRGLTVAAIGSVICVSVIFVAMAGIIAVWTDPHATLGNGANVFVARMVCVFAFFGVLPVLCCIVALSRCLYRWLSSRRPLAT